MATSRAFSGVTVRVVNRIRQVAHDEHGVVFDPSDGTTGTATAHTGIGDCVVHFVHDGVQSVLVLTLVKKPMLLPAALLWSGLSAELERLKRMP
jgi:hypothetical protein